LLGGGRLYFWGLETRIWRKLPLVCLGGAEMKVYLAFYRNFLDSDNLLGVFDTYEGAWEALQSFKPHVYKWVEEKAVKK
jgi:hypothetical protein